MTDHTPPLSVAQARDEILMSLDGDPQYWAALLDALIAAVRAERTPGIEPERHDEPPVCEHCGETLVCAMKLREEVSGLDHMLWEALARAERAEARERQAFAAGWQAGSDYGKSWSPQNPDPVDAPGFIDAFAAYQRTKEP